MQNHHPRNKLLRLKLLRLSGLGRYQRRSNKQRIAEAFALGNVDKQRAAAPRVDWGPLLQRWCPRSGRADCRLTFSGLSGSLIVAMVSVQRGYADGFPAMRTSVLPRLPGNEHSPADHGSRLGTSSTGVTNKRPHRMDANVVQCWITSFFRISPFATSTSHCAHLVQLLMCSERTAWTFMAVFIARSLCSAVLGCGTVTSAIQESNVARRLPRTSHIADITMQEYPDGTIYC